MSNDIIARIIGKKWTIPIFQQLSRAGDLGLRYSELRDNIESVTSKVLIERLRELEHERLVRRYVDISMSPPAVNYALTRSGRDLVKVINALHAWEYRYQEVNVEELVKNQSRMYTNYTDLDQEVSSLGQHEHLCLIHESEQEWVAGILPFLKHGIERKERCACITSMEKAERISKFLANDGEFMENDEKAEKILFYSEIEQYRRGGQFASDRVLSFLRSETEKTIKVGYKTLRMAIDMSWLFGGDIEVEEVINFEIQIHHEFLPKFPCILICQYDRQSLALETTRTVILTHPLFVYGKKLYKNHYYIPPEDFLNQKRSEHDLQNILDNLDLYHETQERTQFLAYLIESSSQALCVSSPDGKIMTCNHAFTELTGYDEEQLREKMSWEEITPGDWEKDDQKAVEELYKTGEAQNYEKELLKRDSTQIPVEMLMHQVCDANGEVQYLYSFVTDITERKKAESTIKEALRQSQEREAEISALLEGSRAILEYKDFNSAARAIFDSCKKIIGAVSGYVALANEDCTENDLLFLDSGNLPCSVDPSLPMPIRGMREQAYRTGKVVYENSFVDSDWVNLLPEGHV